MSGHGHVENHHDDQCAVDLGGYGCVGSTMSLNRKHICSSKKKELGQQQQQHLLCSHQHNAHGNSSSSSCQHHKGCNDESQDEYGLRRSCNDRYMFTDSLRICVSKAC